MKKSYLMSLFYIVSLPLYAQLSQESESFQPGMRLGELIGSSAGRAPTSRERLFEARVERYLSLSDQELLEKKEDWVKKLAEIERNLLDPDLSLEQVRHLDQKRRSYSQGIDLINNVLEGNFMDIKPD